MILEKTKFKEKKEEKELEQSIKNGDAALTGKLVDEQLENREMHINTEMPKSFLSDVTDKKTTEKRKPMKRRGKITVAAAVVVAALSVGTVSGLANSQWFTQTFFFDKEGNAVEAKEGETLDSESDCIAVSGEGEKINPEDIQRSIDKNLDEACKRIGLTNPAKKMIPDYLKYVEGSSDTITFGEESAQDMANGYFEDEKSEKGMEVSIGKYSDEQVQKDKQQITEDATEYKTSKGYTFYIPNLSHTEVVPSDGGQVEEGSMDATMLKTVILFEGNVEYSFTFENMSDDEIHSILDKFEL